eukprot:GEMP01045128.1.p1 GENE.GEMP01045128.1~~GEMP01045128.1.p1  ORF type:complete len:193 (+),score=22.48 GEMP01045128.1:185-763(+)
MKFVHQSHVYESDWDTVTSAFWIKYPNQFQPHVLSMDTVDREIDADKGLFRVRRIQTLSYGLPSWVELLLRRKLVGVSVEEVTCNLKERKMTVVGKNHSFKDLFGYYETCTYEPHPENDEWTLYTQHATFSTSAFGSFSSMLESQATGSMRRKASKGLEAMSAIISSLEQIDWRNQIPDFPLDTPILLSSTL